MRITGTNGNRLHACVDEITVYRADDETAVW